jgi:hypothetical protein
MFQGLETLAGAGIESDFGSLAGVGSSTTGTGPFGWVEVTFTDCPLVSASSAL